MVWTLLTIHPEFHNRTAFYKDFTDFFFIMWRRNIFLFLSFFFRPRRLLLLFWKAFLELSLYTRGGEGKEEGLTAAPGWMEESRVVLYGTSWEIQALVYIPGLSGRKCRKEYMWWEEDLLHKLSPFHRLELTKQWKETEEPFCSYGISKYFMDCKKLPFCHYYYFYFFLNLHCTIRRSIIRKPFPKCKLH